MEVFHEGEKNEPLFFPDHACLYDPYSCIDQSGTDYLVLIIRIHGLFKSSKILNLEGYLSIVRFDKPNR